MSSMMPPPHILIPPPSGAGGAGPLGPGAGAPPSGAPDSEGAGDPDKGSVTDKLRKALSLVQQAAAQEGDDQDAASISKIAADIHKAIAAEQGLQDQAMGAGPGVKLVRKATAASGGAPGGGY